MNNETNSLKEENKMAAKVTLRSFLEKAFFGSSPIEVFLSSNPDTRLAYGRPSTLSDLPENIQCLNIVDYNSVKRPGKHICDFRVYLG